MITEKGTMKTEAIFSDDRQHRYLLSKEWDSKKPRATIIMTNPSTAAIHRLDYTTLYILNNLIQLDFGAVDIVNLTSTCTTKMNTKNDLEGANQENTAQIAKCAEKASKIILAWGKIGDNNLKVRKVQEALLDQLKPHADKLCLIGDGTRKGFHPLAPQIRFQWHLEPFEWPKEKPTAKEATEAETEEKK